MVGGQGGMGGGDLGGDVRRTLAEEEDGAGVLLLTPAMRTPAAGGFGAPHHFRPGTRESGEYGRGRCRVASNTHNASADICNGCSANVVIWVLHEPQ